MDQIKAKGEEWGEQQRETGEPVKGPRPSRLSDRKEKVLSEGAPGDDRTPADTIGEIAYATDGRRTKVRQRTGGAGEPEATPLEPEKQGGIGGP